MSSSSNVPVSCRTSSIRIPQTLSIVPALSISSTSPPSCDRLSSSPKRYRSFPKKQYYRPRIEKTPILHMNTMTPSPLSSSPKSRSESPVQLNPSHPINPSHNCRSRFDSSGQQFRPISSRNGTGSAGDSSDDQSGDSEIDTPTGSCGYGKEALLKMLHPGLRATLHTPLQLRRHSCFCFDVENSGPNGSPIDPQQSPGMILPSHFNNNHRRESFLYRSDNELDQYSPKANSRTSSIVNDQYGVEDLIVTPFAQVLASLRRVRNDFLLLTNINASNNRLFPSVSGKSSQSPTFNSNPCMQSLVPGTDDFVAKATNTLEELDWCLKQLDAVQTHRSVSEMASNKFKKMLNKELTQLSGLSKSGIQVSEYISKTFLDNQNDVLSPSTENVDDKDKRPSSPSTNTGTNKMLNKTRPLQRELHPVNKIAGIRKRNRNKDIVLKWHKTPPFGVVISNEAALAAELEHVDKWGGVDVFKIADLSNGRPLTCIMYTICQKRDMFNKFKLQRDKFLSYIMTLEDHYRNVPYHNSIHAADVVQSVHSLFCIPALDGLFNELEVLSALVASAMHDVDHPGVTNQYHCSNYTELSMIYNDTSVLEMHHLAVGFKLMLHDHCDVFEHFTRKQWQLFRKMIIDMVLATDMSKHMQLVANLKTMVETKKVASSGILELDQYVDRIEVLKNLVHCADLSNPMKPLELYKNWTERITNEWWVQGDIERAIGSEVSPICDRDNANIEKTQVMFIDFVVYPLVEIWVDLVSPDGQEMLNAITSNKEYFASLMPGSPSPIGDKDDNYADTSSNSTELEHSDEEAEETPLASDQNRFLYYPVPNQSSKGPNEVNDLRQQSNA